jgi:hypothetical protein
MSKWQVECRVVSEILASSASVPRNVPYLSDFSNKPFMLAYILTLEHNMAAPLGAAILCSVNLLY